MMRVIGIALLVAGAVFLVMGINATDAPVEQLSHSFFGRYSDQTAWYIAGGIAALVAGGVLALTGGGRGGLAR
jgi:hypothetical protein